MTDQVMIGITHSRSGWEPEMVKSVLGMATWDAYHSRRIPIPTEQHPEGGILFCAGTNIASQRNKIVRAFLKSDCDWLLFLDTDEEWPPDLIERLLASADETERPIVSGLIMARRDEKKPISPACVVLDELGRFCSPASVPAVRWWEVGAVGAGCLLVHRKVYEAVGEKYAELEPSQWFQYTQWSYLDDDGVEVKDEMGEDYTFSLRAQACGFRTLVDTTIQLGHVKPVVLTATTFYQQLAGFGFVPTFVIVPVKDRLDLTQELVEQLRDQGGWDGLFVFDNGSTDGTTEWLLDQHDLMVFPAVDVGIHHMWNAGVEEALHRSGGRCNILFLNNDLKLGHEMVRELADALRAGPWVAVGPNYDGRQIRGVEQVRSIAADRYDGTGGLPGFAFMVRGEWFASGYRFPTDCKWWYGDNDLTMMFDMHGQPYGLVEAAAVEHFGAGTAGDWKSPEWEAQLAADQAAWVKRWAELGVTIGAA